MNLEQAFGLNRSLAVYYGRPWKALKMLQFYSKFLKSGDLAFDVGSHVGNRALIWSILGVRVVAIEPQELFAKFLDLLFTHNSKVTVLPIGLGRECSRQHLLVSDKTPTVSSVESSWCEGVRIDSRFTKIDWNRRECVNIKRLEDLIEEYGKPKFCKIDVEGNELGVLLGLNSAIDAMSFEYLPFLKNTAVKCIERIETLATYVYNWSETESMKFKNSKWVSAEQMIAQVLKFKTTARSGDIYAKRMQVS